MSSPIFNKYWQNFRFSINNIRAILNALELNGNDSLDVKIDSINHCIKHFTEVRRSLLFYKNTNGHNPGAVLPNSDEPREPVPTLPK